MTRRAMILAAHGSDTFPEVNDTVRKLAACVAEWGYWDEVTATFHRGGPGFAEVLDRLSADDITVVPLMTSEGYYCDVVLPRELQRNRRYAGVRVRITRPVGTHAGMVAIVVRRVRQIAHDFALDLSATTLALIGHGTKRHVHSRKTTEALGAAIDRQRICRQVLTAFLDEAPDVESVRTRTAGTGIIAIPFLIGASTHAVIDVPRRLGMSVGKIDAPPFAALCNGRRIVCDGPVGCDAGLAHVIVALTAAIRQGKSKNGGSVRGMIDTRIGTVNPRPPQRAAATLEWETL